MLSNVIYYLTTDKKIDGVQIGSPEEQHKRKNAGYMMRLCHSWVCILIVSEQFTKISHSNKESRKGIIGFRLQFILFVSAGRPIRLIWLGKF